MDGEIALVPYYPNYAAALPWYQDPALCRQVDNRDGVYDLELLKRMYNYLNRRGDLYYIKYRNRLCGDVCLHPDGEINIVVAAPFQNRHIGRRVIGELVRMAFPGCTRRSIPSTPSPRGCSSTRAFGGRRRSDMSWSRGTRRRRREHRR